jgi:hypothetical protein
MSFDLLSRLQSALGARYLIERVLGQGGTRHDRCSNETAAEIRDSRRRICIRNPPDQVWTGVAPSAAPM